MAAAVVLSAAEFADAVICTCYNWEGTDEDNAALVCDESKLVQLNDAGEITGTPCERAALNKLEYSIQVCPSRPLARNRLRRPGNEPVQCAKVRVTTTDRRGSEGVHAHVQVSGHVHLVRAIVTAEAEGY